MKRRTLAVFAACALSACGVIGPPQGDVEMALQDFYANGAPEGAPDLRGATIVEFDGCRLNNGYYECPAQFQTGAGRQSILIWMEHDNNHWRVQNLAINRPTRH